MLIEQLIMSAMAVLMLAAAVMGTTAMANPFRSVPPRVAETQTPARSERVECTIERIEMKELKLTGKVENRAVVFKLIPQVRVTKDKKPAELESLARGDFAVLTLASPGSDVVTKIEALSSR